MPLLVRSLGLLRLLPLPPVTAAAAAPSLLPLVPLKHRDALADVAALVRLEVDRAPVGQPHRQPVARAAASTRLQKNKEVRVCVCLGTSEGVRAIGSRLGGALFHCAGSDPPHRDGLYGHARVDDVDARSADNQRHSHRTLQQRFQLQTNGRAQLSVLAEGTSNVHVGWGGVREGPSPSAGRARRPSPRRQSRRRPPRRRCRAPYAPARGAAQRPASRYRTLEARFASILAP